MITAIPTTVLMTFETTHKIGLAIILSIKKINNLNLILYIDIIINIKTIIIIIVSILFKYYYYLLKLLVDYVCKPTTFLKSLAQPLIVPSLTPV
jgi:hypothetical protein